MKINYLIIGALIILIFFCVFNNKNNTEDTQMPILKIKNNGFVLNMPIKETFITGIISEDDVTQEENIESYYSNGSNYRGKQNKTITGNTCQKWTSQTPHKHFDTPEDVKDKGLGDHNYCRNPDNDKDIWCYTTNPDVKKEYCKPLDSEKLIISNDDIGRTWTLDYDKLSENIKKSCHNLKNCRKINGEVICNKNGKDIKMDSEIYTKCTNTDLISIINNEWKTIPKKNILFLDLTKKQDFKLLLENLQKWVNNASKSQIKVWKSILIDQFKLVLKTRNNIGFKQHTHSKLRELIEHLKLLDLTTYNQVKANIGYSEENIKKIKDKLDILVRSRERNKSVHDETGIRIKLVLQIINSILDNYRQIFYDENSTFYDIDKCRDIKQPDSVNLRYNNIYDLSEMTGGCPNNYYMAGTRYEKGWEYKTADKQAHQVNLCCPIKRNEKNCEIIQGQTLDKLEIGDPRNIRDNLAKIKPAVCPSFKYIKSINYKVGLVNLTTGTKLLLRCGSKYNKYLRAGTSNLNMETVMGSPTASDIFILTKEGDDSNGLPYYSIKNESSNKYIIVNRDDNSNNLVSVGNSNCPANCNLFKLRQSLSRSDFYEISTYKNPIEDNPKFLYWSDNKLKSNLVYNGIPNVYDNVFQTGYKKWWSATVPDIYSKIIVTGSWMREGLTDTTSCELKLEIIDNTVSPSNIIYSIIYSSKAPNQFSDLFFEIDLPLKNSSGVDILTNNKEIKLSYLLALDTNKLIIRNSEVTLEHREYKINSYRKLGVGSIYGLKQSGFEFMIQTLDKNLRQEVVCCDAAMNEGTIGVDSSGKNVRKPCRVIDQKVSNGFLSNNLLSLNKVDGRCPENSYLKSFQFVKEGNELKQRITCCDTGLQDMLQINRNQQIADKDLKDLNSYKEYKNIAEIQNDYRVSYDYATNPPTPPLLDDSTMPVPHFIKRSMEDTLDERLNYKLKKPLCHQHHYLENDYRDMIHSELVESECFEPEGKPKPNFTKDTNTLELYIQSNNSWLNDNLKMSKAQKLLINLIYYKVKGFNKIDIDLDSMFNHFNIKTLSKKHDNNYGEFSINKGNNIDIFSRST